MSIINWTQYRPALRVNNFRGTYIELPAFEVTTGIVWKGASEVVLQYNYSAPGLFVVLRKPTKPTGVNYGLCIRYRVGDTVYRYKLWEDDAFVLSGDAAPLYNGQVIKANFVLEIWSFDGLTEVSQATPIDITSSIRNNITDLNDRGTELLALGAEFSDLSNIGSAEFDTTNLLVRFATNTNLSETGGFANTWGDYYNNSKILNPFGGQITYTLDAGINNLPTLEFNQPTAGMTGGIATGLGAPLRGIIAVVKQIVWSDDTDLFDFVESAGATTVTSLKQRGTTPFLRVDDGGALQVSSNALAVGDWKVLVWYIDLVESDYKSVIEVYDLATGDVEDRTSVSVGAFPSVPLFNELVLGKYGGNTAGYRLADLSLFSSLTPAVVQSNANYLASVYGSTAAFSFPISFNTGSAWLDNA